MSEDQLNAFREAVKVDERLQEKLKAAGDADAVVAIAKESGFVISAEELQLAQAEVSEDDELEGVAGGMDNGAIGTHLKRCKYLAQARAEGWSGDEDFPGELRFQIKRGKEAYERN